MEQFEKIGMSSGCRELGGKPQRATWVVGEKLNLAGGFPMERHWTE